MPQPPAADMGPEHRRASASIGRHGATLSYYRTSWGAALSTTLWRGKPPIRTMAISTPTTGSRVDDYPTRPVHFGDKRHPMARQKMGNCVGTQTFVAKMRNVAIETQALWIPRDWAPRLFPGQSISA